MSAIDAKTKIGLFTVIGTLPILVFCCFWLANLSAKADRGVKADIRTQRLERGLIRIQERLKIDIPAEERKPSAAQDEENI